VDDLKLGIFTIIRIVRSKKWGTDVQKTPNLVEIELQKPQKPPKFWADWIVEMGVLNCFMRN
jgi:hypothetical protein